MAIEPHEAREHARERMASQTRRQPTLYAAASGSACSPATSSPAASSPAKQQRVRWTEDEDKALKEGLRRHGGASRTQHNVWQLILQDGQGTFHAKRDHTAVKDRARNLGLV